MSCREREPQVDVQALEPLPHPGGGAELGDDWGSRADLDWVQGDVPFTGIRAEACDHPLMDLPTFPVGLRPGVVRSEGAVSEGLLVRSSVAHL